MPHQNLDELSALILSQIEKDDSFRDRLIADPKSTLSEELGISIPNYHELKVVEDSYQESYLVLPPPPKYSEAEKEEARSGVTSLAFLRKTMFDPAPEKRVGMLTYPKVLADEASHLHLKEIITQRISSALEFVNSKIGNDGAWYCIRYNLAKPEVPRHFERPPFVTALCVLALRSSEELLADQICERSEKYLAGTIEYPGIWRYYRHLPPDLDSTTLCSLALPHHPWIQFGSNLETLRSNRHESGLFSTWLALKGEPEVASPFRMEFDPIVNANMLALLGHQSNTEYIDQWLTTGLEDNNLSGASKWYPDLVTTYYSISRAVRYLQPQLSHLEGILEQRILDLMDTDGDFGNVLQTAQAASSLYNIGRLKHLNLQKLAANLLNTQLEDGSWPELLAFGDQSLKWGSFGEIGHGSDLVTTAFCLEALERLRQTLED